MSTTTARAPRRRGVTLGVLVLGLLAAQALVLAAAVACGWRLPPGTG